MAAVHKQGDYIGKAIIICELSSSIDLIHKRMEINTIKLEHS